MSCIDGALLSSWRQELRSESKSSSLSAGSWKPESDLKYFKFGGKPSPPQSEQVKQEPPLTLSDIIPLPSHVHAMANASIVEDVIKRRSEMEHFQQWFR